jgi:ABC-type glycerol-3-phosphate transport system substrate-binding protein
MSNNLSRRDMLKGTAAGAVGLAAGLAPAATLASAPSQDVIQMRWQQNETRWTPVVNNYNEIADTPVEIEFLNITGIDHEERASKILNLLAAGQPLDAGYAATEATVLYAGQGVAASLTDRVKDAADELAEYFADMAPILPEVMMWEGDLYQLPDGCNAPNMFINVNMLNKAGLDVPPADWTKDDFVEYATATTNLGGEETYGYGWPIRIWGSWGPWHYVNDTNFLTEERAPGGEWLWETFYADSDNVAHRGGGFRWPAANANDPLMVEALEFVVSLTADGLTPSIELGGGQSLSGLFLSDKVAMTPAGGYWAGGLHNNGMEKGEFDVQYWPKWKSQRHQLGVGGNWLSSFSTGVAVDRMWELLKFSVKREQMLALDGRYRPVMTTTPVRRSMVEESAYEPSGPANWQVFYDTIDRPDTYPIPSPPEASGMTGIHNRAIGLAVSGEMSPQAALDQAQAELEALLIRSRGG